MCQGNANSGNYQTGKHQANSCATRFLSRWRMQDLLLPLEDLVSVHFWVPNDQWLSLTRIDGDDCLYEWLRVALAIKTSSARWLHI